MLKISIILPPSGAHKNTKKKKHINEYKNTKIYGREGYIHLHITEQC